MLCARILLLSLKHHEHNEECHEQNLSIAGIIQLGGGDCIHT